MDKAKWRENTLPSMGREGRGEKDGRREAQVILAEASPQPVSQLKASTKVQLSLV